MCEHGVSTVLVVPVPANLSHTGEAVWTHKPVDACIAPIVDALNQAGVLTAASCCGHGKGPGEIPLQDGRVVTITDPKTPRPVFTREDWAALPERAQRYVTWLDTVADPAHQAQENFLLREQVNGLSRLLAERRRTP